MKSDYIYTSDCGCKVIFAARDNYRTSRMELYHDCPNHRSVTESGIHQRVLLKESAAKAFKDVATETT